MVKWPAGTDFTLHRARVMCCCYFPLRGVCGLETASDVITIRDCGGGKSNVSDAVAVLVGLLDASNAGAGGAGEGVVHDDGGLGQVFALVGARVPGVVLDEADLGGPDAAGGGREGKGSDVDGFAGCGVDGGALPGCFRDVLHHDVVDGAVVTLEIHGAADTGATIRTIVAVGVVGRRTALEGGEDGVNDAFAPLVGPVLDAAVAYFRDAVEVELLGKVIARLVGGAVHFKGEGDVFQTTRWGSGKGPSVADEGEGELGGGECQRRQGELHDS